jgi:hypothetical protein
MDSILKSQEGRHFAEDVDALMAVATSHADPAMRLVAEALAKICARSVAESKELRFREGMARGSIPSNLAAASPDGSMNQVVPDKSERSTTSASRTEHEFAWAREALTAATIRPRLATSLTSLLREWQATLKPMYAQEQRRFANAKSVHQDRRSLAADVSAETYSALLKAYQNFLQMCVIHVVGVDHALPALPEPRHFARQIECAFPLISKNCWVGDEMQMCRAVRQTMAHDHGIDHPRLNPWRDRLRIDDGNLRILPADVVALYERLKNNVVQLIDGVLKQPVLERS